MAIPSPFRIEYTPQQKKQFQARCAFCKKHFKASKLRIGTKLASGDFQWRHTNRKCRAWQYVLSRAQAPEELEGWDQVKAPDKKKVRKIFVPKTKARIMRRETTMPKPPEIPDEHADAAKSAESSESESDEDEQKMEVETQGKMNTPNGKGVQPQSSHIVSHTGKGELEQSCRRILEARMKEINHVFDNGTDGVALSKAKDIASAILAMTTILLQEKQ